MPDSNALAPKVDPKLKPLYLAKIFFEETDEEVGLTMAQIIARLGDVGIEAERKAIYRDIRALQEFGMDIQKLSRQPVEYALVSREFSLPELLLLTDAVQSSRFLTKTKSEALVRSVKTLGSKRWVGSLSKRLHVEGRIKMQNESVYYNVDVIQAAIREKRKISFRYYKYDAAKKQKLQRDGATYLETPVQLIYSDGYYYLVVFNDKHDNLTNYRVDRMVDLHISEERATRNHQIASFDVSEFESRVFGMYTGEPVDAVLLVAEDAMSGVIDRFGKKVRTSQVDDTTTRVYVTVMESPVFFSWVVQFGGLVRIEAPLSLVESYTAYLQGVLSDYES